MTTIPMTKSDIHQQARQTRLDMIRKGQIAVDLGGNEKDLRDDVKAKRDTRLKRLQEPDTDWRTWTQCKANHIDDIVLIRLENGMLMSYANDARRIAESGYVSLEMRGKFSFVQLTGGDVIGHIENLVKRCKCTVASYDYTGRKLVRRRCIVDRYTPPIMPIGTWTPERCQISISDDVFNAQRDITRQSLKMGLAEHPFTDFYTLELDAYCCPRVVTIGSRAFINDQATYMKGKHRRLKREYQNLNLNGYELVEVSHRQMHQLEKIMITIRKPDIPLLPAVCASSKPRQLTPHSLFDTTQEVIDAIALAQAEHEPSTWFVSYSGGTDSAVVLQALIESGLYEQYNMQTMTIDTGIASAGHLWRVINDVIRATGKPPIIYSGGGLEWYENNVRDYGFGYQYKHHAPYYQYLKRQAIEICIRDHKHYKFDRIAFITGVRRAESTKRKNRPLLQRSGSRLTVNAIATFTDEDKLPFLERATWYHGKTTRDCMCNFRTQYSLGDLQGSGAYEPICKLSQEMKANGMWGYGETPAEDWMIDNSAGEAMDDDSLCVDCIRQLPLLTPPNNFVGRTINTASGKLRVISGDADRITLENGVSVPMEERIARLRLPELEGIA